VIGLGLRSRAFLRADVGSRADRERLALAGHDASRQSVRLGELVRRSLETDSEQADKGA